MRIQRWCLLLLSMMILLLPGAQAQAPADYHCPGVPAKRSAEVRAGDSARMAADIKWTEHTHEVAPITALPPKGTVAPKVVAPKPIVKRYSYGVVMSVEDFTPHPQGIDNPLGLQTYTQRLVVRLDDDPQVKGLKKGDVVTVFNEISENPALNANMVHEGSKVLLAAEQSTYNKQWTFYIANMNRTPAMMTLGIILLLAILFLGGKEVTKHLLLAGVLLFGLYQMLFPSVLAGNHPGMWAFLFCIAFVTLSSFFYRGPAQGLKLTNQQWIAILGSIGGLSIMGTLIAIMHIITPLNGFVSTGLASLWYDYPCLDYWGMYEGAGLITFQGFLFYIAWMLAQQRKEPEVLSFGDRFKFLMLRGRRLLGPLISSVSLLFMGLFTPLLLQLQNQGLERIEFQNSELTASVLIMAFTGALTLILSVPLTAAIACWILNREQIAMAAASGTAPAATTTPAAEQESDLLDEQTPDN